jgi:hypothetical protein
VGGPTLYFEEQNEGLDHEWHEYDQVKEDHERTVSPTDVDVGDFLKTLKS